MVKSQTVSISPAQHASRHAVGGADPLVAPLLPHAANHDFGGSDVLQGTIEIDDVIATHSVLNTIHRNISGQSELHLVRLAGGAADIWTAYVENVTPPTVTVQKHVCPANAATIIFVVENNDYYKVTSSDGTNTIDSWVIFNL